MGPLEQEIAELLNEAMSKTTLGLEIRVGGLSPDAREAIESLSQEQRVEVFLEGLTGWANALRRIARRIDEADPPPPAYDGDG